MIAGNTPFGFVGSIYITATAGEPMSKVPEVLAVAGRGLEGDRYASKTGFWQTASKARQTIRDVSLVRASDIEISDFTEAETRRNIIVHTELNLVSLIGKHFCIGEALLKGFEECTPCKRPSELSGKTGFANVFKDKGGLRAQVIRSGRIRAEDSLILVDP